MRRILLILALGTWAGPVRSSDPYFYGGKVRLPEEGDYYFEGYTPTTLQFFWRNYTDIEDGRHVRLEGDYQGFRWVKPFRYQEKLNRIGLSVEDYHLLEFTLKDELGLQYAFPLMLFPVSRPPFRDLETLTKGSRVAVYAVYRRLPGPDPALRADVIEWIGKGGHRRGILYDGRTPPTPTPTPTVTPTPGPSLWKRAVRLFHPEPTPTPTGTWTPPTPEAEED